MDALPEWIEFVGTLSWLPHGCSVGMDEVSSGRYHGWGHGCSVGMDRVCGNVIMVATWMLCGNGWRDALWEWIEFVGTLSWLPHGCSVGMDEVSSGRYHGWDMDALWEWIEFVGTLSWLPHGCSAGMDGGMLCRNG